MAQPRVGWDKFTFQRSSASGVVIMKESLGPQEGLGDLHILICRDILPLALLEG